MFYVIENKYVGPNVEQNIDASTIDISTTPAITNMSHEVKLHGWCGTTNDWCVNAHGAYETIEAARAAIAEIFGDVRDADPYGLVSNPEIEESYKNGKFEPLNSEATGDWAYESIRIDIDVSTTDARIKELVIEYENNANSEGVSLHRSLEDMMLARRQELRDENDYDDE